MHKDIITIMAKKIMAKNDVNTFGVYEHMEKALEFFSFTCRVVILQEFHLSPYNVYKESSCLGTRLVNVLT